jgi:hypothetical protein
VKRGADEWESGRAHVEAALDALKRSSWEGLRQLPARQDLPAPPGLERLKFAQWSDAREDGSLRIVIQQYRPGMVAGKMAANGFVMYPSGEVEPVPQDELWEYT